MDAIGCSRMGGGAMSIWKMMMIACDRKDTHA